MAKKLAWIGTTILALAGLIIGVLPIDIGPRWVWFAVGIALGTVAGLTFVSVWKPTDESIGESTSTKTVNQKPMMTAGDNSNQIVNEGGGTFNIGNGKEN
ncbi:hypothetical protein [Mycolicibacterium fluoranthenivorans]|uniref:Uncharacterized protein n=1 Tax=Mycolicibacterium fluoranthenivorans TaxID=258505 RepID=A0A1G4X0F6_9MYCO|nr:hypothetical protein [Mycolicibacterium fluoranthenivorans]SCX33263.1 hypothetical protein SAMN02799620_05880 [Mycolicibacterium fluoranthenivorans]